MLTSPNHKTDGCHYKWEETCTHSHGASCLSPSSFSLSPSSSPGTPPAPPTPLPGSLCFICNLINSSEVEPLTHPVPSCSHGHRMTPITHSTPAKRHTVTPATNRNPVTWVIWHTSTQTHNRSGNLVSAVWFKVAIWLERRKTGMSILQIFLMRRSEDLQVQRDQTGSISWASWLKVQIRIIVL